MWEQTLAVVRLLLGAVQCPFHWCNAPMAVTALGAGLDQEPSVLPLYVTQATANIMSL